MLILKGVYTWNKLRSLKSLVMLKCGSRTSLHAVLAYWQQSSILMFCSYYLHAVDTLFLYSLRQQAWHCFFRYKRYLWPKRLRLTIHLSYNNNDKWILPQIVNLSTLTQISMKIKRIQKSRDESISQENFQKLFFHQNNKNWFSDIFRGYRNGYSFEINFQWKPLVELL